MIKVYTGFKGFLVSLFFVAGIILLFSILFWGIEKAAELFLPVLIVLSYLLIIVFLLGILPATYVKDLRPKLSAYSLLISQVLGVSTWMMSFFFVIKTFGVGAMILALLFQFLAPVAIIGAMFKDSWGLAGHLMLWITMTYVMKYYSQWLLSLIPQKQENGDIIDVEAIEVRDH